MNKNMIIVDEHNRELHDDVRRDFPYFNRVGVLNAPNRIRWHWHPEMEFALIAEGSCVFHLPELEMPAEAGSLVFVNSGVFHEVLSREEGFTVFHTQLIHRDFLSGGTGTLIDARYFTPVIQCGDLKGLVIRPDTPRRRRIIDLAAGAHGLSREDAFAYEIRLRILLSEMWMLFLEETQPVWKQAARNNDVRGERMRQMLTFIAENCSEKLTLKQIADSAGISERECLRCFQTQLKSSPFDVLTDYRLRMAARMLSETSESITNIALACGFGSASYFCRKFHAAMLRTPSEYRKSPDQLE